MEKQTVKKQKVFLSLEQLYLSIFAIILSLLITALIMLVSGENPINAFQALLAGALGSKTAMGRPALYRSIDSNSDSVGNAGAS